MFSIERRFAKAYSITISSKTIFSYETSIASYEVIDIITNFDIFRYHSMVSNIHADLLYTEGYLSTYHSAYFALFSLCFSILRRKEVEKKSDLYFRI